MKGLRGQSGFGWNEEKCLVTAPQDIWDQYIEVSFNAVVYIAY